MIDIKDNTGKVLYSTPINKGSKRKFELMKDDYIMLKFTLEHPVVFGLGTYAECDFGRFEAVEEQSGTFSNTSGGYGYELKLEADYMKWRNKLFKYQPEVVGGNEASWSLTAPLATHMGIFLRCLKAWGYKHGGLEYQYLIDETVTGENLYLTYSNTNLIDALTMMAEAAGCEWWVDGADIHFGRMADGVDPVTLELGDNAVSMTLSKSSGDYFTRIYAFGSTSNISPRYRKKLEFTVAEGGWYDTVDGERCIAVVPDKKLEYGYFRNGACSSLSASKDFSPTDIIGLSGNKHNGGYVQDGYLIIQNTWDRALINIDVSKLAITFNPTTLPCTFHTLRIGFDLDSVMNGTAEEFELNGSMQQISLRYKYENVYTGGDLTLYYRVMYGEYDEDIPFPISAYLVFSGSVKVETVYKRADITITMEDGTQCDAVLDPFYKGESELSVKNGDIHHSYFDDGKKFTLSDLVRTKIPIGYFDADVDGLTVNGVVQRRLMLPEGIPYVDLYEDMHPDEVIEGVVVFDYVFPGKVATVSSVSQRFIDQTEEYTDDNGETQERPTGIKLPVYTIKTADMAGFTQDYIIGDDLTVTFQTGSLAGLTFGAAFLPDESTDEEAAFEIVANEDYGGRLPDEIMKPSQGDSTHEADTFVMTGYDTEYMFNDLTAEAEQRLYQETLKYKEKLLGNRGTVTASLFSDWSRDKCATDGTLHPLAAGGSVSIDNKALFPAPVTMRVIGYELNLDIPFDTPQYTIGESPSYSRLGALESKIDSVSLNGSSYMAGGTSSSAGGTSIKLIRTNDRTAPSDTNAYSAARTDKEIGEGVQEAKDYTDGKVEGLDGRYLSKVQEDRTWFPLHLGGGADFGSYMAGLLGGKIDATGAAELLSLILRTGLESDNFSTGALGAGFCLKKDENGDAYIEVDRMLVRKIATFVQLMIQELKHVGGQIVLTPASMKCSRVVAVKDNVLTDADGEILYDADGEVLTDSTDGGEVQFYRCYFEATDGEKTINNEFAVGDQARCQTFNVKEGLNTNASNTYYWRLVTGVGDDYIDLSATDCDAGSQAPAAGDEIVQLGNRTDATRQTAIILSAYGNDAPYIKMYKGINSYSMDGKEFFTVSRTAVDITADRIRFAATGQNVEDAMAEIAGEAVKGVSETVDGLVTRLTENINFVSALSDDLEIVKKQADGAIESFFGKYDPTAENEPASGWTEEEDKARHAKDTFTNISTGHSWSWVKDGDVWKWVEIEDTATTKALADAARAQDTADGKRRVFVATPTDASEYDPGDLWVNATYGDYTDEMLRCNTKKAAEAAWSISHWEKASKYTDDSTAKAAAKAAEEAAKEAKAANDDLAGFKSDSLISPVEKTALRQQMADIKSEYADTTANASRYGVSAAAYVTAYGKALAALEKYTEASPEFIPVEADYADISAYYANRASCLNAIAVAAKSYAEKVVAEIEMGGRNYARNTINMAEFKTFQNKLNQVEGTGYKCTGLKKGDVVTVSFDYEASGLTWNSGGRISLQFNDLYSYANVGAFVTANGRGHASHTLTIKNHYNTSDPVTEDDVSTIGVRMDYISGSTGAYLRIWNFMVNKGEHESDWSPAPEDLTPKATFEVLNDSVKSMVEKLDYNPATGATKYETKFEQTEKEITSLATKTDSLGTRVSSVEQTAEGITATVSGLNGRVSTIEQTAEEISLKVESIEPVNLFRDGSFERGENSFEENSYGFFYDGVVAPYAADKKFGKMSLRVYGYTTEFGGLGLGEARAVQKIPVEAGATYTLVVWKKAANANSLGVLSVVFFDASGKSLTQGIAENVTSTTSWGRSAKKGTAPSGAAYAKMVFSVNGKAATDFCLFDGVMFLKGDWTGLDRFIDNTSLSAESLLATGIDIENRKVTVTSDSFEVRNNAGNVTARVNENGLLQVGSGEFSGLIRQVPFLVENAANDDRLTLDGENYIELKEENLVTGGFIVINQTSNSYVGQGINLPVGFRYAGTRIFIIKRWASLGNFTIRTVPEDLPDGYTEWREPSAVSGGELFRIRNKTAVAIWMGDSGSWDNEFVELVAMPKSVDIESGGRKAYGHVEWVVMNAWQWAVKSDGGRNVGYRQNGY